MRAIISKIVTSSMVAGAALMVAACGDSAETTTDNTIVTDLNSTDTSLDGTMTDNMTAVDGAMGNDAMLANDTTLANDTALGNDTATTNAM
ncbi:MULTISPECIES: hypothetical protein [Sphingomonas]|uniref:hypothetical protein n=1 Tax=Sphingomonas TaxID=13687 RepID=UPI000F7DCE56|nr:hypothetical protein [Sphingomonas sp. ABOLF]RSV14717.1 hypothetical protein CA235_11650 [Sphingomonas sp. ABOLF]GLK19331.1 hypothetical protein GCM10017606_01570 [Microbacterium terregens]